jgi:hypothetical protein
MPSGSVRAGSQSFATPIPNPKKLIEAAYTQHEIPFWNEDEAGPFQTVPFPGRHWRLLGQPERYPHEYIRNGTAKQLTLFHPASGRVRVKGVTRSTNTVLHPWLKEEIGVILDDLPEPKQLSPEENRGQWERWQEGLSVRLPLPDPLPPLRMLLIWDNLQGHHSSEMVGWLLARGVMPLYTPVGGSCYNMAESVQHILKSRALDGQYPRSPAQIIAWLEATARGWNTNPTPFVWGGLRAVRRRAAHLRQHRLRGSGACRLLPLRRPQAA